MKVSYTWLQAHIEEKIPVPEKVAELFTFGAFEVEHIEHADNDTIFDIKVLPDRAHYALGHRGMAYELAAIAALTLKPRRLENSIRRDEALSVEVDIRNKELCTRYIGTPIHGITVKKSPEWLENALRSIGQRSINNVVDIANYVMFDTGQPLHAFDADKVVGGIIIRSAKKDEHITTLDKREAELSPEILVIADEEAPLAIAGIKGGTKAGVTSETKNIILEAAHFDPAYIRKISTKLGIKTDASKRYENEITPEFTSIGSELFITLLEKEQKMRVGKSTDVYVKKSEKRVLHVNPEFISSNLGFIIPADKIKEILMRLGMEVNEAKDMWSVTIPHSRLDIAIPEDLIEEVGRIYGYEKIPLNVPPLSKVQEINKNFYYAEKIRDILVKEGFSEIYTSSFENKGEIELQNALASDKGFLRSELSSHILKSLEFNVHNADLLGLDQIKIFEIGKIFTKKGEFLSLAIGMKNARKLKVKERSVLEKVIEGLEQVFGAGAMSHSKISDTTYEIILDPILEKMQEPKEYDFIYALPETKYKPISVYPFISRDIAVFVPEGTTEEEERNIIISDAGELLQHLRLFDVFTKSIDGKSMTSYAYRLVFQSYEKTLSDNEVNEITNKITNTLNANTDWRVR